MLAIHEDSESFTTYNGPSYPGYRALNGQTNVACLAGTYRSGFYGDECRACPAGRFCADKGMSEVDTYLCAGGSLCRSSSSSASYEDSASNFACPQGYYCQAGALHPMRCADGFYTSNTGNTLCAACPADYYCNGENLEAETFSSTSVPTGTDVRVACATGSTCGGGVGFWPGCDPGKYSPNGDDCMSCPKGRYCRGGADAGQCTAGYLCDLGNSEPDPWAGPCPAGYYCPHGTLYAITCPPGTMGAQQGAM